MHEIEELNRTHALDYYKRFYTPENAILVVAGDVDARRRPPLADATYGRVTPQGTRPVRIRPREPEPRAPRRIAVADPKVEQPTLQRLYLVPPASPRATASATRSNCWPRCSAAARPPTSTASSCWSAASR